MSTKIQTKKGHYSGIWVTIDGERKQINGNDLTWKTHSSGSVACVQTAQLPGDNGILMTSNRKGSGYMQVTKEELGVLFGNASELGVTVNTQQ